MVLHPETTTHSRRSIAVSWNHYLISLPGPDPADPSRVLIRKVVQVNETTYGYEEVTITKREADRPSVHSKLTRIGNWDMQEFISVQENKIRRKHQYLPNILSFSMYYRLTEAGKKHWSLVENSMQKSSGWTWGEAWKDFNDRRDLTTYLKNRWFYN